jgi:hypothetical protein
MPSDWTSETRRFGSQSFLLRGHTFMAPSRDGEVEVFSGVLWHLSIHGIERDLLGSFYDLERAWAAAAQHAAALEISGHCDGTIAVRIARSDGKIHQSAVFANATYCGLGFVGEALSHRVPGDGRDHKLITCYRCRRLP